MRNRNQLLGSLAMVSLVLSGCAAASGAPGPASTGPTSPRPASTAPRPAASESPPIGKAASRQSAGSPSEASKMICGQDTKDDISKMLALKTAPHTVSSWADSTYTCTYHLAEGPLVISVKESADPASARKYYDALEGKTAGAAPIEGLANLGFPAYQTTDGSVVFLKDNSTLYVNATALPAQVGPHSATPTELAYQVSTTVLACWTKHH